MSSTMFSEGTVKVETAEGLQACRICLGWDVKLYNIHECGLDEMYVEITGTRLSAWDGFPQHVCVFCRAALVKAHVLRARSRRADLLLRQALVHQHFITNDFIRAVDRSKHRLTHTLAIENFTNDTTYYFNHETPSYPELHHAYVLDNVLDMVCIGQVGNLVEKNDAKKLKINHEIRNYDSEHDDSSDVDRFVDMQDDNNKNASKTKVENNIIRNKITETYDSKHKNIKAKRKKPIKIAEKKNKIIGKIEEIETLTEIKGLKAIKRKVPTRQKDKSQRKVRHRKGVTQTFTNEEDFKEFEKKYNFQVQCLTEEEMKKEMEERKESDKYFNGEYKCELCYKGFLTSAIYENHMKTHDPARGDNECQFCHLRYQYPVKLRQHVQNAHRLKFRCVQCNDLARGKACAVLHAAYHAGTTFQCAHCDKQFLKKTSRTSHMRMAHPAENAARGTCELCGETFTSSTGLRAHKTRSHYKASFPELRCRKCRVQFDSMEALKRHKELQVDNKCDPSLSACEQCGESCASADALIQHRHEQHAVPLFTCDTCTKSFTSKASLATHIDRVHRRIRPPKADYSDGGRRTQPDWLHWASVCEHCGKRLSCMATLKIHMNKHTGERPYKCSLCPKAYMTPYGLNNHQAFHTGVRKWQCPECPATFMHQSSVYQHRKIHTGERSHQCTICEKYFTQSGSLYTHVKYVHMKETPPPRRRNKKTNV